MKKRTLNQTWMLCLRMWRWVAKVWYPNGPAVSQLKMRWLSENGFGGVSIASDCFFCHFQKDIGACKQCPGVLINPSFSCYDARYSHKTSPVKFYKELLRLNRIRKVKK